MRDLAVIDLGNVAVVPSRIERAMEQIEVVTAEVLAHGTVPIAMGGDGSVTLPQLRAAHKKFGKLAIVHCDAHTDAWDVECAGSYTTTTTFLRAHEEGLLDAEATFHIGIRGTLSSVNGNLSEVSKLNHTIITMDDFVHRGPTVVATELLNCLGRRPVYLCWDMDFFDPSAAPGVAIPEWGGASAREGINFLRALGGLNNIAFDINNVSPPHDVHGLTGNLAARIILDFLDSLAARESGC